MPVIEAMAAFDQEPKSTTDRYQEVKSNDVITINATLPSRQNNKSVISYSLGTACPPASTTPVPSDRD